MCRDCNSLCKSPYHVIGFPCSKCDGFNTVRADEKFFTLQCKYLLPFSPQSFHFCKLDLEAWNCKLIRSILIPNFYFRCGNWTARILTSRHLNLLTTTFQPRALIPVYITYKNTMINNHNSVCMGYNHWLYPISTYRVMDSRRYQFAILSLYIIMCVFNSVYKKEILI